MAFPKLGLMFLLLWQVLDALPATAQLLTTVSEAPAASQTVPLGAVIVRGQVLREDGLPLPGATVLIGGTHQCTATNGEGDFMLPVGPTDAPVQLICNFEGYKEQILIIQGQPTKDLRFQLQKKEPVKLTITGATREL